jgi:NAD(P)-dependent dehydrogenase (short-subunit alcohol dehydrogenase family)
VDIRDAAAVDAMVQRIWDESGPLTGLVNNAAGNFISPTKDLTPNGFNAIANIVFHGTFYVTHAVGKRWIAGGHKGSVISILVTWVHTGSPFVVPSAMSKAGLHVMTKSLAVEWGKYGIRLNGIAPGPFPTEGATKRLRPARATSGRHQLQPDAARRADAELQNLADLPDGRRLRVAHGETIAIDGAATSRPARAATSSQLDKLSDADWDKMRAMIKAQNDKDRAARYDLMAPESSAARGDADPAARRAGGPKSDAPAHAERRVPRRRLRVSRRLARSRRTAHANRRALTEEQATSASARVRRDRLLRRRDPRVLRGGRHPPAATQRRDRLRSARALMHWRNKPFREMLEARDLYVRRRARVLRPLDHRAGRSRRFDARFFVALAPRASRARTTPNETVHDVWITPREALERGARGEIELVIATPATLKELARFASRARRSSMRARCPRSREPRLLGAGQGRRRRSSARATRQYFEIHWSDPEESGRHLRPRRRRAEAPRPLGDAAHRAEPGLMTGPGHQYVLVGGQRGDRSRPGDRFAHREILKSRAAQVDPVHAHAPGPLAAARRSRRRPARKVLGRPAPAGRTRPSSRTSCSRTASAVELGRSRCARSTRPGTRRTTCATCSKRRSMLFTGDHVMQGSTVVINPPDGDMRAYLHRSSAARRGHRDHRAGHGYLIGAPHKELRRLIAHRLDRERKVVAALSELEQPRSRRCCRWCTTTFPSASTRRRALAHRAPRQAGRRRRGARSASRYTLVKSALTEARMSERKNHEAGDQPRSQGDRGEARRGARRAQVANLRSSRDCSTASKACRARRSSRR